MRIGRWLLTALVPLTSLAPIPAEAAPADANPDWVSIIGQRRAYDVGERVVYSPFGKRVYTVGIAARETMDLGVRAFSASTGRQLWVSRYDGPGHGFDHGVDAAISPDGRILYVLGRHDLARGESWVTLAYRSSTGRLLWKRSAPRSQDANGPFLLLSPNGGALIVAGTVGGSSSRTDMLVQRYNTRNGNVIWRRRLEGPLGGYDALTAVTMAAGKIYVAGRVSSDDGGRDGLVASLRLSDGVERWRKIINHGADQVYLSAIAATKTRVAVPVHRTAPGDWDNPTGGMLGLSTRTGETLWEFTGSTDPGDPRRAAWGALLARDGRSVVSTFADGQLSELASLTLDTGEVEWFANGAQPAETSPDGKSFYTLWSYGPTAEPGWMTVAVRHDARTGAEMRRFRFDDPYDLWVALKDLAVSPNGEQIVVSGSTASRRGPDGSVWYYHHDHLLMSHCVRRGSAC